MNIVYGGAFNPPTIAHENAIKKVLDSFDIDRFIVVPVGAKYHLKDVDDTEHRFNMAKIMCDECGVEISRIELDATKYEGTYQLLQKLNLPNTKFMIGSDNLKQVDQWIQPDKILSEFGLIVLNRQDDIETIIDQSPLLSKYKKNIMIVEDFEFTVSSSMFRETLDFNLLSEKIKNYIIDNDLYGGHYVS